MTDNAALEARVAALEAQVELLAKMLGRPPANEGGLNGAQRLMRELTMKEHAVMQMLAKGASNAEIAARLGVGENTAKGFVHSIFRKARRVTGDMVYSRVQVAALADVMLREVGDEEYLEATGLEKTWHADFSEGNPGPEELYRTKG